MTKLMEQRSFRLIVCLLLLIMLAVGSFCVGVWSYGVEDGWNYANGFMGTSSCLSFVQEGLWYVQENIGYLDAEFLDNMGSYAGRAFSYSITLSGDYTIVDTTRENSYYVVAEGGTHNGINYIIGGYIDLPVERYDGCYVEYALYDMFSGVFPWIKIIAVASFCAALVLLVLLLITLANRSRTERPGKLLSLPLELVPIGYAVMFCVWVVLWLGIFYDYRIDGIVRPFYWIFVNTTALTALLCLIVSQTSARILRERLLATWILRHVPLDWWIVGVFLVQFAILFVTWAAWEPVWSMILIPFDVIVFLLVILFNNQRKKVQRAAKELAGGNLSYKVDTRHLGSVWWRIGESLNQIGDGMSAAVEERMKSERMKTELITNVSHDLKTPLTSIINYVHLLKDETLSAEATREYLEILDRQSAKLKKLTEDVMEASKAASGVIAANAEDLNASEVLEQTVGEFARRMLDAGLEPVVRLPEEPVILSADSALLGRVLENLMTNIIKYAQTGTRVYFDLVVNEKQVHMITKNISREPLNISADELMARFVRGDRSRNSEGSGLGLSIAKSLTELMGGKLNLVLDGDLFKAELIFDLI